MGQSSVSVLFDFYELDMSALWHEARISRDPFLYPFFASDFYDEFFYVVGFEKIFDYSKKDDFVAEVLVAIISSQVGFFHE